MTTKKTTAGPQEIKDDELDDVSGAGIVIEMRSAATNKGIIAVTPGNSAAIARSGQVTKGD